MSSIYGYYNGESFVPSSFVDLKKNQKVIILPIEDSIDEHEIMLEFAYSEHNRTKYIFNEPYRLVIRKEKGKDIPFWYCAEDENLKIDVMEESLEEAVKSFYSDIDFLWNFYGKKQDEKLTKGAVKLKNNINGLVKEVVKL